MDRETIRNQDYLINDLAIASSKFADALAEFIPTNDFGMNQQYINLAYELANYFKNYSQTLLDFLIEYEKEFDEKWENYLWKEIEPHDNNIKKYLRR
jgi:hypothetical protein